MMIADRCRKSQITNNKFQINNKSQIPKLVYRSLIGKVVLFDFGHWLLWFACNLVLGIWDLRFWYGFYILKSITRKRG
jgi:hypothetical protein